MKLNETDENLMSLYQVGEEAAFLELYRRYHRRLYGYLRHQSLSVEQVEEVFQNIWTKLHQSRFRYDAKFKFSAWLFTIARSVRIDFLRKESKFKGQVQILDEAPASPVPEIPESLGNGDLDWQGISPEDRKALEWRYLEDSSFEEIAQRLGLSPSNVRQRISRALKRLKGKMSKRNP